MATAKGNPTNASQSFSPGVLHRQDTDRREMLLN
jgi:hypothetical protein